MGVFKWRLFALALVNFFMAYGACMYIYVHTYIYCIYIYIYCIYIHTYIHAYTRTHAHLHTYIYTYTHTYIRTVYEIAIEKTCKRLDANKMPKGTAVTIIISALTVCAFGPLVAIYGVPGLWET